MTTATKQPAAPAKRFRLGSITVTVWPNTDRQGRSYFTTSITRSYRDGNGQWKDTASLRSSDLPVVRTLTDQAQEWLIAAERQDAATEQTDEAESVIAMPDQSRAR